MKKIISILFSIASLLLTISCNKENEVISEDKIANSYTMDTLKITVGTKVFTAKLYNNASATAFKDLLPLNINMSELNGNEKYYYLSSTLPTNATVGGNIKAGDLMLYGNNCIVLFYEDLNTPYSYTKIGKVDDSTGLANALGSGSVNIKFELE